MSYTNFPPKPPIKPAPRGVEVDARSKPIQVGDIACYFTKVISNVPTYGKIVSIEWFEDYQSDWITKRWVPFTYSEVRFENSRCVRPVNLVLKLEQ